MLNVPTRRLFVYIAAGLVVLVVGTLGLLSTRSGSADPADGVVIEAGDTGTGAAGADYGFVGLRDGLGNATVSSVTTTTQVPKIWVQVAGAVRRPGVYQVSANARAFEVVSEAGGFADDADQEAVALAAQLSDGCRVYVPRMGESAAGEVQSPTESSDGITGGSSGGGSSSGRSSPGPVSLNSATLEQLDNLPGIGPSLAQQILTYRETHGPFTSIDELDDVPGIGSAKLEQLRPLVGL
jgi:competence protein ComEA